MDTANVGDAGSKCVDNYQPTKASTPLDKAL
jgi:hypothetical protein